MLELNDQLILLDLDAANPHAVITALAEQLCVQGLVTPEYGAQTIAREIKHPTGLPTEPFCIAFPHADSDGVNKSALAVAILSRPVVFQNMADPDEDLNVHIVLMLANKSPEEQIQTLRNLAVLFGEPEKLVALRSQPTPASAAAWLRLELNLSQDSEPLTNP